jgi:hypothetical protein
MERKYSTWYTFGHSCLSCFLQCAAMTTRLRRHPCQESTNYWRLCRRIRNPPQVRVVAPALHHHDFKSAVDTTRQLLTSRPTRRQSRRPTAYSQTQSVHTHDKLTLVHICMSEVYLPKPRSHSLQPSQTVIPSTLIPLPRVPQYSPLEDTLVSPTF